jgi:outer membrane protein W
MKESSFSMGLKTGFGHSYIMPYSNCAFKPSWEVGLSTILSAFEHLGVGIDALYSSEGATFKNGDLKSVNTIDYFRIPVKAYWFFGKKENDLRPMIGIGPSLGFILRDTTNTGYSSIDYGLTAVAGVNYRLTRGFWLNVMANYYHGLKDIYAGNSDYDRNGHFRLELGLLVGF